MPPRTALVLIAPLLLTLLVGLSPSRAAAQPIPGHTLLESLVVPVTGASVVSTNSLAAGESYKIRASGTMQTDDSPLILADAEYASFLAPIDNTNTGNVDLGIAINDTVNDSDKPPSWGPYDASHIYTVDFVGLGAPVSFNFHDSFYPDNAGSLTIEVFAPLPGVPMLGGPAGVAALVSMLAGTGALALRGRRARGEAGPAS